MGRSAIVGRDGTRQDGGSVRGLVGCLVVWLVAWSFGWLLVVGAMTTTGGVGGPFSEAIGCLLDDDDRHHHHHDPSSVITMPINNNSSVWLS